MDGWKIPSRHILIKLLACSVQKQAQCLLLDLELMDTGGVEESTVDHREGNLSKEYGKGAWTVALQSRE